MANLERKHLQNVHGWHTVL